MFSYSRLRQLAGPAPGLAVLVAAALGAEAQTPVKFTLDWRFEGPAAPFTVALDKGYFKAEGLDVTIDTVELERRTTGWAHRSGMAQG